MADKRNTYDWVAIERDFRTDQFSLRELAAKHGPSPGQISKRAKAGGWKKDLTEAIGTQTKARLAEETAKATSGEGNTDGNSVSSRAQEEATVKAAAEARVQIVLGHRKQVTRLRLTSERVLDLLDDLLNGNEEGRTFAMKVLCITKGDGMTGLLTSAMNLVERVIRLERQAFGLDESEQREDLDRAEQLREDLRQRMARLSSGK